MELYTAIKDNLPKMPRMAKLVRYVQFKEFPSVRVLATKKETSSKDIILVELWRDNKRIKGVRYKKDNFNLYVLDSLLIWYYMEFIYDEEMSVSKRNFF